MITVRSVENCSQFISLCSLGILKIICINYVLSIFMILGNKLTLVTRPKENGISTRDELLKFHNSFYSANIMALVVLGRGSGQCSQLIQYNYYNSIIIIII